MTSSRLFLTGPMGSGKSTAGPLVADGLGYRFVDLDERVEQAAGRSATELFADRGEDSFRALETAVLSQVLAEEGVVIATGGGALTSEATMAMAQDGGIVAYLRVPPETLAARLSADETRPLLRDADGPLVGERLLERIQAILDRRERFYSRADVVVEADGLTPPDVAANVVAAVLALDRPVGSEEG